MLTIDKRKSVDLLVEQFWKQGYLTLSRRFGTYLPEPSKVGKFDVDIVARHKKSYAIGITLNDEDFRNPRLIEKLNYLASRHTKFSQKRVLLFVGVPEQRYKTAKDLIDMIEPEAKRNIKLFPIVDRTVQHGRNTARKDFFFS